LFGSYARKEATEESDVDIVLDSGDRLNGFDFFGIVGNVSRKFPKRIDMYEMREINSPSRLLDKINEEGVLLYESAN
jgi:predicted nucleotidyltransferase